GHGVERGVESLLIRNASSGRSRNSYWPMPFRKRCRITVTNEGRRRSSNLDFHVDYRKLPSLPQDVAYFHAWYRQELPATMGRHYPILDIQGRGHYVGTVFSVVQNQPGWFGEGDEFFYVDGNPKASIEGTGTEDYFNDAWSLRVANGPYTGVPVAEGTGEASRMTAYRWHVPDPVPFRSSLRLDIEHAGWTYNPDGSVRSGFEERADLFSTVAFWYQQGIARNLATPPYGIARLPHGNATQIEIENAAAQVKAQRGKVSVQKEVFWSRDILFLQAEGPGARFDIPFDVAEDGRYELLAQVAHAPDYGTYRVLLDGKPVQTASDLEHEPGANTGDGTLINAWHTELYVAEDHVLAWTSLTRGPHTLTFICVDKDQRSTAYHLGLDTLVLARIATPDPAGGAPAERLRTGAITDPLWQSGLASPDAFVRAAAVWRATQDPALAARGRAQLSQALADASYEVRGLAAAALRNLGPQAVPALGALSKSLQDPDTGVRMMSAKAIAALGSAAAPALEALIAAGSRAGEHVQVLRSVADALGAIGPPARPAIPTLQTLRKIPRVQWNAEAAIARIGAQ
ncbi:MAG: DUF2961 domain-containing protein, partial [Acidobacteria bacterium]|nr:DUF2961 domain-containing protein [Acidobacteriota bacterium]